MLVTVLQLTPDQITALDPAQRASIIQLVSQLSFFNWLYNIWSYRQARAGPPNLRVLRIRGRRVDADVKTETAVPRHGLNAVNSS